MNSDDSPNFFVIKKFIFKEFFTCCSKRIFKNKRIIPIITSLLLSFHQLHLEDCQKVPLPCPNKCDRKLTIARDELDKHIEEECPRTKIVCQFEEIGCPHRVSWLKIYIYLRLVN